MKIHRILCVAILPFMSFCSECEYPENHVSNDPIFLLEAPDNFLDERQTGLREKINDTFWNAIECHDNSSVLNIDKSEWKRLGLPIRCYRYLIRQTEDQNRNIDKMRISISAEDLAQAKEEYFRTKENKKNSNLFCYGSDEGTAASGFSISDETYMDNLSRNYRTFVLHPEIELISWKYTGKISDRDSIRSYIQKNLEAPIFKIINTDNGNTNAPELIFMPMVHEFNSSQKHYMEDKLISCLAGSVRTYNLEFEYQDMTYSYSIFFNENGPVLKYNTFGNSFYAN